MQASSTIDVVARCIVRKDRSRVRQVAKEIDGVIVSMPQVGNAMVIYRRGKHHRMVTSPVVRVMQDVDSSTLYVETKNSIYHVVFSTTP